MRIAQKTFELLIEQFLALPWQERAEVFVAVKHNGIFCAACGYGERATPNPDCQCENDE